MFIYDTMKNTNKEIDIDKVWEYLSSLVVGETFEHCDTITGIRFIDTSENNKVLHRGELWFSDLRFKPQLNTFLNESIVKELPNIEQYLTIQFKAH